MSKLLVLFTAIALWLPQSAHAAKKSRTTSINGQKYVAVKDWAARESFSIQITRDPQPELTLSNGWSAIHLTADSRKAEFNGVVVSLSYPPLSRPEGFYIAETDVDTLFGPLIEPPKAARKVKLIAISAGHGGKDPGNENRGHHEKKYTLLLATELDEQLREAGYKTVMIRDSDEFVELDQHAEIANKARANAFISVHYNSAADPAARGIEVYSLTPVGATPTNGGEASKRSPGNRFDEFNVNLAYHVQKAASEAIEAPDRGMKRAGFVVLREITMPGILVEGGFMTNSEDAKTIYSEEGRRKLARAIVDGLNAYKRLVERN